MPFEITGYLVPLKLCYVEYSERQKNTYIHTLQIFLFLKQIYIFLDIMFILGMPYFIHFIFFSNSNIIFNFFNSIYLNTELFQIALFSSPCILIHYNVFINIQKI